MSFPESERVIYKKNPLSQVICQLRFPSILRIDRDVPAGFQERIRDLYPIFRENTEVQLILPPELAQQIPSEVVESLRSHKKTYDFVTSDEKWAIGLTNSFMALTSREYKRWEGFLEHLEAPFEALKVEYSPSFFSRVGLRYQNIIRKSDLGLDDVDWSDLLNPYIVGELASPDIADSISEIAHIIQLQLDDNVKVTIRHGFAKDNTTREMVGYIIDNDFFIDGRTEVENAIELIARFNAQNRQLFRWCIGDKLHKAMGPESL